MTCHAITRGGAAAKLTNRVERLVLCSNVGTRGGALLRVRNKSLLLSRYIDLSRLIRNTVGIPTELNAVRLHSLERYQP
jgi:hypothetical protein